MNRDKNLESNIANVTDENNLNSLSNVSSFKNLQMKLHSLKQTKDLVLEIIQAKQKYDELCVTNR